MKFTVEQTRQKSSDAERNKKPGDIARKAAWRKDNPGKHRETRNAARNREIKSAGFIGVDGEGMRTRCLNDDCACHLYVSRGNDSSRCKTCNHAEDSHYHAYVLLGVGERSIDTETLGVPEITWEHAFEFLYQEFTRRENRYKTFCGFFLGYDFTQIFKSLPEWHAWSLYNPNGNIRDANIMAANAFSRILEEEQSTEDNRPFNPRKPKIASRIRPPKPGGFSGKPWPVRIAGERGAWEFDTLDERQLRLRPFNCGCADKEYHTQHCDRKGCIKPDHHLHNECGWRNKSVPEPEWMYVNDVGSFFQKSFLSVINPEDWYIKDCADCQATPCVAHGISGCATCKGAACPAHGIVTREEYIVIRDGKSRRSTAVLDDEMREYNALENELLARVMNHYKTGLRHFGITLGHDEWYGPGAAAGKWISSTGKNASCNPDGKVNPFDNNNLPEGPLREVIDSVGAAAYRGGWFEIFAHGHIPGTVYEYDINSAYPHIIRSLPCLIHGKWEQGFSGGRTLRPVPKNAAFRFVHCTVKGSNPYIGTMLHRRENNGISRPQVTHGWFLQSELEAAMRAGLIDEIDISCNDALCPKHEYDYHGVLTLTYYPSPKCGAPLKPMEDMYLERIRVGKNTSMGKAAKLVYNSVYGKYAQLIGNPRWASNIYASLITAGCRNMILDAIATHPGGAAAVVMVATDGVYFTTQHPTLPLSGNELGKWEQGEKNNLTLFKPGVYWDDKTRDAISAGQKPVFKARGVNARDFAKEIAGIDAKFSTWDRKFPESPDAWPSAQFEVGFTMVSCRQALMRGKWDTAGKVTTAFKVAQNSIPGGNKRQTDDKGNVPGYYDAATGLYRSYPPVEDDIVSKPRESRQALTFIRENTAIDTMITPTGDAGMVITEALGR